jgi:hypothetical protein
MTGIDLDAEVQWWAEYKGTGLAGRAHADDLIAEVRRLRAKVERVEGLPREFARVGPNDYPMVVVRARDVDRALDVAEDES